MLDMKNSIHCLTLAFTFTFLGGVGSHAQTFCCDPDAPGGVTGSPLECGSEDGGYLAADGAVCDADCAGYDSNAPECVPLDGGLSLLALAGGGLATAAMRRRREEEARQADES